jgi:hypothetical protein
MNIDLSELERRIGVPAPRAYRELVHRETPESLARRGFDPKTLLVLNLNLRSTDRDGYTRGRFFFSGDGCGNYYFVELQLAADDVMLWAHDPPCIEDLHLSLEAYLPEATQWDRIDSPEPEGRLRICRTSISAESILDPIELDEWIAAVNSTSGVEYLGYREGKNPFTGDISRVTCPGFTRVLGVENQHISLCCGRGETDDTPLLQSIATTLAEKLRALVLPSAHVG